MEHSEEHIARNVAIVRQRVVEACARVGRDPAHVRLVAVTKQRPAAEVAALIAMGEQDLGENRVQEVRERVPTFPAGLDWHFIGHLQSNKAKYLPGLISWVHSVDSAPLAVALNKAWERHPELPRLNVLLQLNIAGEEQKYGTDPVAARALLDAAAALPRLHVRGLMCMAPYSENPEDARPVFRALNHARAELQAETGIALPHLSMGMTGDFEVAVEEGATLIRVGSALFEDA